MSGNNGINLSSTAHPIVVGTTNVKVSQLTLDVSITTKNSQTIEDHWVWIMFGLKVDFFLYCLESIMSDLIRSNP